MKDNYFTVYVHSKTYNKLLETKQRTGIATYKLLQCSLKRYFEGVYTKELALAKSEIADYKLRTAGMRIMLLFNTKEEEETFIENYNKMLRGKDSKILMDGLATLWLEELAWIN